MTVSPNNLSQVGEPCGDGRPGYSLDGGKNRVITLPFSDVIPDGMYHIVTRCNIDVLIYISPIARSPQSTKQKFNIKKGWYCSGNNLCNTK